MAKASIRVSSLADLQVLLARSSRLEWNAFSALRISSSDGFGGSRERLLPSAAALSIAALPPAPRLGVIYEPLVTANYPCLGDIPCEWRHPSRQFCPKSNDHLQTLPHKTCWP